jgi:hypothetical protein
MAMGDVHAIAAGADELQAQHCREWLANERAELVTKLSKYEKMFEKCVASSDLRKLSHLRGLIRHSGNAIREIDRMLHALESRFADPTAKHYGPGAGEKPDGVVAVTLGVALDVSGVVGGVVVVTVCPVACGATGPTACPGAAELTSPKITPSAPIATTALTPMTADNNLTLLC